MFRIVENTNHTYYLIKADPSKPMPKPSAVKEYLQGQVSFVYQDMSGGLRIGSIAGAHLYVEVHEQEVRVTAPKVEDDCRTAHWENLAREIAKFITER